MAKFVVRTELDVNELKEVNEFKSLIPYNNQYEELKKSIKENSFLFPIIVNQNKEVIDGYTRLKVARELGISKIPVEIYETGGREEELEMILNFNIRRRQLTKDEIIMLIDKVHEMKKKFRSNLINRQITETDDYVIIGDKKIPKLTDTFSDVNPNPEVGRQKFLFDFSKPGSSNNSTSGERNSGTPSRILTTSDEIISGTPSRISATSGERNSTTEESREIKEELRRLVPGIEINEDTIRKYLKVKEEAPWLINYIGDEKKGKIGIVKAYEIYRLLKKKNLLDLDKRLPENELTVLVTDKYGRKVLERDDLLRKVLDKEMTVSDAVNEIKGSERGSGTVRKNGFDEIVDDLVNKGYAELPFDVVLVKLNGKCYVINEDALSDLENGSEKWEELAEFLLRNHVIIEGEVKGIYDVPWKLLGRCIEWKSR